MNKNLFELSLVTSAVLSALLVSNAYAEEAVELNEVNVSAKRLIENMPAQGYQGKTSRSASRTETAIKDTPQSITVITQDLIKDQSIQSIAEAVRYVPGVTISQGEGNRDAINFRGAGVTTGDFYIDGVRDDIQTYRDLYNTERIEVLRGPNAMIFGRGGSGGVINRVSKEAGWDPIRELSVTYGAFDQKRSSIDIGNAINDIAAFRLNAVYEDANSYRNGVTLERYGFNPTLTIKPSEATKVILSAEYFMDKRIGDRGMPSRINGSENIGNRPYDIGDHSTFFGSARLSPNETETKAFNATIDHTFDNGVNIRNISRYADYDKFYDNVYARTSVSNELMSLGAYRDDTKRENLFNQTDISYKIKFAGVEHKLLIGMELARQETDNRRFSPNANNDSLTGTVSVNSPYYFGERTWFNKRINRSSDANITAFYLQDQIVLNPNWELVLGVRHDRFDIDYKDLATTSDPNRYQKIETTDNKLSPRAGLIFKPQQNISIYASYSQSFVPRAGDQLSGLTTLNANLSPEKFINQELGIKVDLMPELSLTAAIYKLERENLAVTDPNNPTQSVVIDGQQTKGLELGVAGKVTSNWSVFGGYALQDAEITKDYTTSTSSSAPTILSGTRVGQTPRQTFSLWNKYQIDEIWSAAIGIVGRSEMYALTPTVHDSTILPGYTRIDGAIFGQLSKNVRLQVNLENLTNKEYALSAHNNNNILPGSPLAGRATLIYNF
jgi:catecholate siderophore receptor